MVDAKALGDLIQDVRKSKNITQKRLSELSGINMYTLRRVEQGVGASYMNTYLALFDALDMDVKVTHR